MSKPNPHFRPVGKRRWFFAPPQHVRMAWEFGVPPEECKAAMGRADPSGARTILAPFLIGATAFGVLMGVRELGLIALKQFIPCAYEWCQRPEVRPFEFVVWLIVLVFAEGVYRSVQARIVRSGFRKRLTAQWCVHCGYDLAGLPKEPPSRTCPECGKQSPVATLNNPS